MAVEWGGGCLLRMWWRGEWQRKKKWDWGGKQERLRVQRQTVREEVSQWVSSNKRGLEKEREEGSHRRHGKSLSLEQSQELFVNAVTPRQRLVWGWHAAVAGYVGVTSAPGPGGLNTRGYPSGEERPDPGLDTLWERSSLGNMRPKWRGGLPRDAARVSVMSEMEGKKKSPSTHPPTLTHPVPFFLFLFHPTPALYALSPLPFLCSQWSKPVFFFCVHHKQRPTVSESSLPAHVDFYHFCSNKDVSPLPLSPVQPTFVTW